MYTRFALNFLFLFSSFFQLNTPDSQHFKLYPIHLWAWKNS